LNPIFFEILLNHVERVANMFGRRRFHLQAKYCIPCDHVPVRSWALFKAKDLMRELFLNLKAEPRLASFPA
jgi:hypothetical protein